MPWSETAKNEALDGLTVDLLSLHDGDPGAAGTDNEISGEGYARQSATFGAADAAARNLSSSVDFSGPGSQAVSWIGVWEAGSPDVFKARIQITEGDTAFNSAGEYTVTTDLEVNLDDCP